MSRTLVNIPDDLLLELGAAAKKQGISRSELIRRLLSSQLKELRPQLGDPRDTAFGLWKDREDIGDGVEYQRKLRAEWDRDQ